MNITIPEQVFEVLFALRQAGFSAYFVGGCVRDFIMHREPDDYDVSTDARPEQVKELFSGHTADTGLKHGTVTVLSDHFTVEVTTYRVEGAYTDFRHPDSVIFTDRIEDDLARRDFTINAIAYSPYAAGTRLNGRVDGASDRFTDLRAASDDDHAGFVDPYSGIADIRAGLIRAVGNPEKKFAEDALRIMRCLRFSSVLGFETEKNTAKCCHEMRSSLSSVSRERIAAELIKTLCGDNVMSVLGEYPDVMAEIIPQIQPVIGFEQKNTHHCSDVYGRTIRAVASVRNDGYMRLAALLHNIGKPHCFTFGEAVNGRFCGHDAISARIAGEVCDSLKLDSDTRRRVVRLTENCGLMTEPTRISVRRALNRLGRDVFFDLLDLKRADNKAQSPELLYRQRDLDVLEKIALDLIAEDACFSLKTLAVDGRDVIAAGIAPGPEVGAILRALLDDVIEDRCVNEKEALLGRIDVAADKIRESNRDEQGIASENRLQSRIRMIE